MRLFIGVWLSPEMTVEAQNFIASVQKNYPGYKWTSPENLHFTLKFLGEVPREKLAVLKSSLNSAVRQDSFLLRLGSIGYFPSVTRPRIIWVGLVAGEAHLMTLAQTVENSCAQAGFSKEDKPFQPHLTIARARDDFSLPKITQDIPTSFKTETQVSKISLIESQLLPKGPVYKVIEDFHLLSGPK